MKSETINAETTDFHRKAEDGNHELWLLKDDRSVTAEVVAFLKVLPDLAMHLASSINV